MPRPSSPLRGALAFPHWPTTVMAIVATATATAKATAWFSYAAATGAVIAWNAGEIAAGTNLTRSGLSRSSSALACSVLNARRSPAVSIRRSLWSVPALTRAHNTSPLRHDAECWEASVPRRWAVCRGTSGRKPAPSRMSRRMQRCNTTAKSKQKACWGRSQIKNVFLRRSPDRPQVLQRGSSRDTIHPLSNYQRSSNAQFLEWSIARPFSSSSRKGGLPSSTPWESV
jgi:hypothetical protein